MTAPIAIPTRAEAIEAHRQAGGGVAAVFPIHYPRELLRAFGLLPVEVWGPPGRAAERGEAHLQSYTCSIVRCGLSFVLAGGLDDVQAILVPHACDSLQGLGSVLLDFVPPKAPVFTLYPPRGRRPVDLGYLAAELRSLADALAATLGRRPSDDELRACIEREEAADDKLASLIAAGARLGVGLSRTVKLWRAREYLPAERFSALADEALAAAAEAPGPEPGVVLSGLVAEPAAALETLEQIGLSLVADDLACCGRRLYRPVRAVDPFERMAERLLSGPPDPTQGCAIGERNRHLLSLCRASNARGVVFLALKFCEPEQFYLPRAREALEQAGLRTLALEVDLAEPLPDGVVTRMEAFAETLAQPVQAPAAADRTGGVP